jgi:hypothetical protein
MIRDLIKKKYKTHTLESASILPFQDEEKEMKWEARKIDDNKWGVFLMKEFCSTDEPVCYGACQGPNAKNSAQRSAERLTGNFAESAGSYESKD